MSIEGIGNRILSYSGQISEHLRILKKRIGEYVNLYRKRNLISLVKLSNEQKSAVDSLWKKIFGKKIPYHWHRLYTAYTGVFDPLYFPEIFFSTRLEPKGNGQVFPAAYEDKAQLDLLLNNGEEKNTIPTIVGRTCGQYFCGDHTFITPYDATLLLHNAGKIVLKPTIDTDSGRNVRILICMDGTDIKTGQRVDDILVSADFDFIIQPFLVPHQRFCSLYSGCINTIRIVTYALDGKVYHCPLSMRIGSGNAEVDNIHAGGFTIALSDTGRLHQWAFSEYGMKIEIHPDSDIRFADYQLPSVPDAIALVERLHMRIPRLMFISWDVTIQEDGKPIVVEMNTRNQSIWFPQMTSGRSMFGENTEAMIKRCRKK